MKKSKKLISLLMVAFLFVGSQLVYAQPKSTEPNPDNCKRCINGITDLTDVQKQKIEDLTLAHTKSMTGFKNQMNEKNAHLKTLQSADKADMTAINKTIDEISAIKGDMMKTCAANKQSIRALLTDKQKIVFDANANKGGCSYNGMGAGKGGNCSKSCNHGGGKSCCKNKKE
ncbi:MAG: hypothetical protein A2X08_08185 [Bacteroidetes bacterium GWA2_32_17]|nr:MAG: hypothetical protein A2X08_08185 [Bacteroidetes bacterium GWA2_32_17]